MTPIIRANTFSLGLDFGTSNSAVTCVDPTGTPRLALFTSQPNITDTYPSILYFEREMERGVASLCSYAGAEAITRYLSGDSPGRLMRSLKAYLADRRFNGTSVYGRHLGLVDLIAAFLKKLLEAATVSLGPIPSSVVVGRPVHFSNERAETANAFAQAQLLQSVRACGFERVIFEYEPVAAAYSYEQSLQHDELILVGDFGGGTSDFSILPVGPDARRRGAGSRVILGSEGVAIAGDAFDRQIVRHLVAPALGFGTEYQASPEKTLPIPNAPYASLEQWHSLSLMNRPQVLRVLERLSPLALDSVGIEAFAHFIRSDLGLQLHDSVRDLNPPPRPAQWQPRHQTPAPSSAKHPPRPAPRTKPDPRVHAGFHKVGEPYGSMNLQIDARITRREIRQSRQQPLRKKERERRHTACWQHSSSGRAHPRHA